MPYSTIEAALLAQLKACLEPAKSTQALRDLHQAGLQFEDTETMWHFSRLLQSLHSGVDVPALSLAFLVAATEKKELDWREIEAS